MSVSPEMQKEVNRRRTFAIISHPDAGKTTLTEKLLLYGGAIHLAGSVKARKASRHAVSDWMEIEKQRGISVTSSVMQFDYNGYRINILDTPGHQDFSEDTYRTLIAADSAVMLIDGAKGVEAQTVKLFKVCRMRGIPIFTFVNKMDRAAKEPFELMDEIEQVLGIHACPVNWPIGIHGDFKGVYQRQEKEIEVFSGGEHGQKRVTSRKGGAGDEAFQQLIGDFYFEKLQDDIELLDHAGDALDMEKVQKGELTPMFFGSAMNNFGVQSFLEKFLAFTSSPLARTADVGVVNPLQTEDFSGFVFKIQANMNPAHRDRIAFMRICSGAFDKGMEVLHVQSGKMMKLAQPQQFMAQERVVVEKAFPGDIIGLFDPGVFRLGDTLCTGQPLKYEGIPVFAPEFFAKVQAKDSMKRKQFIKGVTQLSEEGAVQTFKRLEIGIEEMIVGVVGVLQFEVLEHRLRHEYGVELRLEKMPYRFVRWVHEVSDMQKLKLTSSTLKAIDRWDRPVLLFENDWSIRWAQDNNKKLILREIEAR